MRARGPPRSVFQSSARINTGCNCILPRLSPKRNFSAPSREPYFRRPFFDLPEILKTGICRLSCSFWLARSLRRFATALCSRCLFGGVLTPPRYTLGRMRRTAFPMALALAAFLSGCSRTTDNFAPRIVISSPSDGGMSPSKTPTVKGYALDDTGVTKITVNGKSIPIQAGSRKIANFQFATQVSGPKSVYEIAAYDAAGNESTLSLPITVDAEKPQINLKAFERAGRVIRVSGVATDNVQVSQILVDGNRLNITPAKRVEFYAETTGIYADIEVYDAAGNKTNIRAQK